MLSQWGKEVSTPGVVLGSSQRVTLHEMTNYKVILLVMSSLSLMLSHSMSGNTIVVWYSRKGVACETSIVVWAGGNL